MKKSPWVLVPILLAMAGTWLWRNEGQARGSPAHPHAAEPAPSSTATGDMLPDKKQRLDGKALQLVEDVRNTVKQGGATLFHIAMDEILHRYEGDPNPLVLELADLLDHPDPQVRIHVADVLLLTDLRADPAQRKLREIIRAPGGLMSRPDEEEVKIIGAAEAGPEDLRILAAHTLAKYGIKEASGDIWDLYQRTKDQRLVRPLRRLNEPRIIDELRAAAVSKPMVIGNMKLIGEYRYEEALPELKKIYGDVNSDKKARFRTLFPLWRLTGEEKYFEEFAASFSPSTIPIPYLAVGGERERRYLTEMLNTARSDRLYKAAMALHLRFHDDAPLKKILAELYQNKAGSNWSDWVLARRLVGSMDDEGLKKIVRDCEASHPTGHYHRDVIYKKKWRYPEWEEPLFLD